MQFNRNWECIVIKLRMLSDSMKLLRRRVDSLKLLLRMKERFKLLLSMSYLDKELRSG
jgi:hypothetical protein